MSDNVKNESKKAPESEVSNEKSVNGKTSPKETPVAEVSNEQLDTVSGGPHFRNFHSTTFDF